MSPKPKVIMIAAVDQNGALGANGTLPWQCPADLRRFQELTMGKILLMGRKTADSLVKPLRGRVNLVLTRNGTYQRAGFHAVSSVADAIAWVVAAAADGTYDNELWVIGGGVVYRDMIDMTDLIHLTQLQCVAPDADTWFPMDALVGFKGCMVQPSTDPNVSFWVYQRDGIPSGLARHGICVEMDLNCVSALWIPPGLRPYM